MRVAIVGAGFSGVGAAIALRRAGLHDFRIFERADDLGGTWRENTYPGAACDAPTYWYSFSHAQRKDWSRTCSPQEEILAYLRDLAAEHHVTERIAFGTAVERAEWDDEALTWTLTLAGGDTHEADALILGCGQLSRPSIPRLPGAETFAGRAFHSAEWDHDYDLRGKRVAVVGTGASAVQFIPALAERVERLHVFQRSAGWVLPRKNAPYGPLKRALVRLPGWQRARRAGFFTVGETLLTAFRYLPPLHWALAAAIKASMRVQVRDPVLWAKLKPRTPFGCKRILFSSTYLPALQRLNVELVADPVARVEPDAVVTADGARREVDCIVWGTGFRANDFVVPLEVAGRGGRTLQEAWDGAPRAHKGITVAGFPNAFLVYGPNTNLGSTGSIVTMIEAQLRYVVDALGRLRTTGAAALDVRPAVQEASTEAVQRRLRGSVWTQCSNWYVHEGRVTNNWPGYMTTYIRETRAVDPAEYEWLRRAPARAAVPA